MLIPDVDGVLERGKSLNKKTLVGIRSRGPASRTCRTTMTIAATSTTSTWGTLTISGGIGWSLRTGQAFRAGPGRTS
jgi:hypothetical protein